MPLSVCLVVVVMLVRGLSAGPLNFDSSPGLIHQPSSSTDLFLQTDPADAVEELVSRSGEGHLLSGERHSRARQGREDDLDDGSSLFPFRDGRFPGAGRHGQMKLEDPTNGFAPIRRAFSPWGGKKRVFNPWGGKRFQSTYTERKPDSLLDKRPGFQPWGGKRDVDLETMDDKRAFNPWGGKRDPVYRPRDLLETFDGIEALNKNFLPTH